MKIERLVYGDELWQSLTDYSNDCSWQPTGKYLSNLMKDNKFSDWESAFVALDDNTIVGFCAITKTSTSFGNTYSPYIGFIFVDEQYRGKRISEKMCVSAIEYAKSIGYDKVYLYSDHVNFYEKYGFIKIDEKQAHWGAMQSIYMHTT